ncbi:MAG: 2-hydroxychromene-2-carboxylate isomerase, partial [Halioglobus sp.]|nr:2-hydroxychromene-2-carboxylate isomerase [Halioglobus sp.]
MAEDFQEMGGAATMDPGSFRRWMTSRIMTRLCRPQRMAGKRAKAEQRRLREGRPHVVELFYQVDDGYSHLLAQVMPAFAARYDVVVRCHLVTGASGRNAPEPALLARLSRYDARLAGEAYGLEFPSTDDSAPAPALVASAASILAQLDDASFLQHAAAVGEALWARNEGALDALAATLGRANEDHVAARLRQGTEKRAALSHYSAAMLFYEGEWYWGVDRLYHLEERLAALGADRLPAERALVPRPDVVSGPLRDNGSLTLEVFPSLRSPYTAISFD